MIKILKKVKRLVELKTEAFKEATGYSETVLRDVKQQVASVENVREDVSGLDTSFTTNDSRFMGKEVVGMSEFIYNHPSLYDYMKYAFLGNYYDNKILRIYFLIILALILALVLVVYLFGVGIIFIISLILAAIAFYFLVLKGDTGESYKKFYDRTFRKIVFSALAPCSYSFNKYNLSDEELKKIFDKPFTRKKIGETINFDCDMSFGDLFDLEIENDVVTKEKDGSIRTSTTKAFSGLAASIKLRNSYNKLRGNSINISSDETLFSSLTEDTFNGMISNKLEFDFNSEEVNKAFDGRISGYNGFGDVDEMMLEVNKIIRPSFEEHMLFLRERFNTFNMKISDDGLTMNVNNNRSLFQDIKHNDVFNFKRTYREEYAKFRNLSCSGGIDDFVYYRVFPYMERLFLAKYLNYLYAMYMDYDNYFAINSDEINSFESKMKIISDMELKEFKEKYTDKIKKLKKGTKELSSSFEIKIRRN